jgi:hypothetical protein
VQMCRAGRVYDVDIQVAVRHVFRDQIDWLSWEAYKDKLSFADTSQDEGGLSDAAQ